MSSTFRHWPLRWLYHVQKRLLRPLQQPVDIDPKVAIHNRKMLHASARVRRLGLLREVLERDGAAVQAGPFAGMSLEPGVSWGDGDLLPKLFGIYEREVLDAIDAVRAERFDAVINIGAADGYYAVGAARALDVRRVFAIDTDPEARALCLRNAAANGVADRVEAVPGVDSSGLADLIRRHPKSLIVCDCEGCEDSLIDEALPTYAARCHFIVECHDFAVPGVSGRIAGRLKRTHRIDIRREGPRDPSAIPACAHWDSLDRWLAVSERRPEVMTWVVATPTPTPAPDRDAARDRS